MELLLALIFLAADPVQTPLLEAKAEVESIRGLDFRHEVERGMRTRRQLRAMLIDELGEEEGGAERYREVLEAMQLVEPDEQLIERMLDAYEQQVLAWYDPETGQFYELSDPAAEIAAMPLMKQGVLVHELTHALQDQWFGIGERLDSIEHDWDRAQAYHAVLEGEASLVMLESGLRSMGASLDGLRESGVSPDQMIETMRTAAAGTFPSEVDPWFIESMKFPYIEGLRFVLTEWGRGGWDAVHAIHANPPISTEEIYRPELWRTRLESGAEGAAALAAEEGESTRITLGEFAWRHLLGEEAAAGVDRAIVSVTPDGEAWRVRIESQWDTVADAREFEAAYGRFLAQRKLKAQLTRDETRVTAEYVWGNENLKTEN